MVESRQTASHRPTSLPMSALARSRWTKFLYLLSRLLQKATFGRGRLHIYLFCAQPIGTNAFFEMRDDPQTIVKSVAPNNSIVDRFPRPPKENSRRFEQGASCYAVTVKDEFAGHVWLARGSFDEDEVRCRYVLPADQPSVWDFDVYVQPQYRLGRTMGRLWKGVDEALHEQGIQWSYSRISLFNMQSIQTHERLGALRVASGVFVVLGALQLSLFSTAPFVHIGLGTAQRPTLLLCTPIANEIS